MSGPVPAASVTVVPTAVTATVEVRLDIHAPADAPLPELAAQVRERVWEAADRELGMGVTAVDIRVTDLVSTPMSDDDDDDQEGGTA